MPPQDRTLEMQLSDPYKTKRIECLRKLKQDGHIKDHVLDILLDIENVPATIVDSREKERHLECLLKALRHTDTIDLEFTQICAFQHLLGSLYINFEKFWGPTVRIIIDLLTQTKFQELLLTRLLDHLTVTNRYIYDETKRQDASIDDSRPDHVLHRNFVFQILAHFKDYVEANNEQFMEEFFLFVDREIRQPPFIEKTTAIDLTSKHELEQIEGTSLDDAEKEKHQETKGAIQSELPKAPVQATNKKSRIRWKLKVKKRPVASSILEKRKSRETFVTVSKIIQSFSNITKVHRAIDLKLLILELLCCRDVSIQRAAFNCLCAYDIEALRPYVDTIRRILNEKQIRSELTVFSINAEESSRVLASHREQLIPIIQRIVFGRMLSSVGKKTSGRDKSSKRKDFVMRFIAGCTQDEIHNFFELLFGPIHRYLGISYQSLEERLMRDLDIKNYIPINKLQAMLNTIDAFMKSIGHLRENSLPHCLKLINIIAYNVITPLENQELVSQITNKRLNLLKNVRRSCMTLVTTFFKTFEYYSFSQDEINFTFKILIWPSSQSFVDRNHASVTPILRLIEAFCQTRVYHRLLIKRNATDPSEFLLNHIMSLYSDDKTDRSVIKSIGNMIADLIQPDRNILEEIEIVEQLREPKQLNDNDSKMPDHDVGLFNLPASGIPEAHRMLLCYIPLIFERLGSTCQKFIDKKDINYRFEKAELLILSSLSGYLKESEHCILATKLLTSSLEHLKSHELILDTLKTAQSLMRRASTITDHSIVMHLAKTLYYQRNLEQRHELCNLVEVLSNVDPNLMVAHAAIRNMNCRSEEFAETPDLAKWNEGFHIASEYFENLTIDEINDPESVNDSIILLIHQVGFIINTVDKYEFSIRDSCLIFYEKFAEKLKLVDPTKNKDFLEQILGDIILGEFIKKGLRNTNDLIKHLYLGIARTLAMNCAGQNKILSEFRMFCNSNQDLDFWFNIRHIQLHNRSKALARLANDENLTKVSPKTLSSFFMPLASGFLFNRNYKSMASLVENSIKIIGIICRNLNWNTYESTLSYYLNLLTTANATYQRTNIKLLTEILRNFNFDITTCPEAVEHKAENERLEKRMRKRLGPLDHECDDNDKSFVRRKRLNPSSARIVYMSVMKKLLPRLNSCFNEMTRVEFEHDKNMADYMPEKDEIKRIPVAFAIVQLLNLLPCKYIHLRDQLPALFLKLASFLKSRNEQTRKAARATLIRIMKFVGPVYIPDLLRIMRQNLDKGFYVHVLNYTICSVLEQSSLVYGDLDSSSHELIDMCLQEIFGKPSEDKEIAQVLAKTSEAKKTKSYDTLLILASYISDEKLHILMSPLKTYLKTANDSKTVNKLSVCLQRVFTGLAQNHQFPLGKLLDFIHITIEESIPSLRVCQKVELATTPTHSLPTREDRFLITKEKTKDRLKSKINERGNLHIVVENALRLLLSTFEKNKLSLKEKSELYLQLDTFIKPLAICLKSTSPRCVTRALKCLYFVAQTNIDSPTFKTKCNSIVKKIFILLSMYNGVGMVRGDNFEMIGMCFKTLSLLMLRCEHVKLDVDQVRAIMSYIEQDLNDATRQATAFRTLHSLIQKRCESPELPEILNKVAETLVTSSDDSLRLYSIKIWQTYLLEYKHDGDKLQTHLNRFLRQLDYEYIDGRKSVLRMLRAIVEKFPERILRDHFELFFYLLAQRVVNDESKEVRELVGRLISLLLRRLPDKQALTLNKFILPWSYCDNLELNMLGIKLTSILIEACPNQLDNNKAVLAKVLSTIIKSLERDQPTNNETEQANRVTTEDRISYHSLRLFKRLLDKSLVDCTEFKYIGYLGRIWQIISRDKLTHRHEPVVLASCMLYMHFIKHTDLDHALKIDQPREGNYIEQNATRIVITLCDKFIDLLNRFNDANKIHDYVTQILIALGQMVAHSKSTIDFEENYANAFNKMGIVNFLLSLDDLPADGFIKEKLPYSHNDAKKKATLIWLSTKIIMQARKEAALYRLSECYRRRFVLRWTAAIGQELGVSRVAPYAFLFMTTPARELTDKDKNKLNKESPQQDLAIMSEDLLKFIKSLLGLELFNKLYAKVQLHYTKRRVERKKAEAIQKIRDQSRGVKRKLTHRKEKDLKRRKSKVTKSRAKRLLGDRDIRLKKIRT